MNGVINWDNIWETLIGKIRPASIGMSKNRRFVVGLALGKGYQYNTIFRR